MPDPVPQKPNDESTPNVIPPAVGGDLPGTLSQLVQFLWPGLPSHQRGIAFALAIFIVLLGGISALVVFQTDGSWFAYGLAILATIVTIVAFVFLNQSADRSRNQMLPLATPKANSRVLWTRRVPRQPLEASSKPPIASKLNTLRLEAFGWLSDKGHVADPLHRDQLRANIFLPDYDAAKEGAACVLYMDPTFQSAMDDHPDRDLKFRPGEGATGSVFLRGRAQITRLLEDENGVKEWEQSSVLSAEQRQAIHPDLKWIVSMPIRHPDTGEVMAVINIDCLRNEYPKEILQELPVQLLASVTELSSMFGKLPLATIRVSAEEETA